MRVSSVKLSVDLSCLLVKNSRDLGFTKEVLQLLAKATLACLILAFLILAFPINTGEGRPANKSKGIFATRTSIVFSRDLF